MDMWQILYFLPACFALNMAPGPNNLLSLNNARLYSLKAALIAGLGRIAVFVVMIVLSALGLAVILYTSEMLFLFIKLVGVFYLFWIAFNLWKSDASPVSEAKDKKNHFGLMKQEFFLAAGNPKAILIFTAFLPQFIDPSTDVKRHFIILGSSFLLLEMVAITLYAVIGIYLRHWFKSSKLIKRFNRACAAFLMASGANILLSRQS